MTDLEGGVTERKGETEQDLPSADSLCKWLQEARGRSSEARSLDLHPGLPYGKQGVKHLDQPPLTFQAHQRQSTQGLNQVL